MTDELLYEVMERVAVVTFNRPQARNAFTFDMYTGLARLCREVPDDGSVRAMILTGAGDGAFAAGTDIAAFRAFEGPEDVIAYERQADAVMTAIEECPVPTIAAIAGSCTGGGAAIAACCDIRLASRSIRFGVPIARTLGNCLSIATLERFAAIMGPARVKEMLLTARLIEADEALRIGLVSELLETHAALMARAHELGRMLAGHAPLTLRATKEGLHRLRAGSREDEDLVTSCYLSDDFKAAIEAFLAKRKPVWRGR